MNLSEAVKESLWHIDAQFEEEGWDQPPRLLMVLPDALGIELKPLPGWDMVVPEAGSAQRALTGMVHAYDLMPVDLLRVGIPTNLFALAFVSEGWSLSVDKNDEAAAAAALKAGEEHTVHTDPHRVEVRVLYLQPVAGERAMLMHERDGVVEMTGGSKGGEIPRLLGDLMTALTR